MPCLIFDIDGVVLDTPQRDSWGLAINVALANSDLNKQKVCDRNLLTPSIYQQIISGRSRLEGARAALAYFGVLDPTEELAEHVALLKDRIYKEMIRKPVGVYADAIRLAENARRMGIRVTAASSSTNAAALLSQAKEINGKRLIDFFESPSLGAADVPGKPSPETFIRLANHLGVPHLECIVIEDAVSGVRAAKLAKMKCVGVERPGYENTLQNSEADWIVKNLDELPLAEILAHL